MCAVPHVTEFLVILPKASVVDQGDRQALHVTPMLLFAS